MVFQVSAHQTDFYQPVADALQRMEQQLHELTDVSEASGLPFELSAYRNGKGCVPPYCCCLPRYSPRRAKNA